MSEQTVATIEGVTSKEGATNGKPWRKYSVKTSDGTFYSTFDKALGEAAHGFVGQRAQIGWKASGSEGQYRDIISVAAAPSEPGIDASAIPTERNEAGETNWDIIGLRKTRCLLWAEYLSSPLAASITVPESVSLADAIGRFGETLVTRAERDIYWRPIAADDEGIPF